MNILKRISACLAVISFSLMASCSLLPSAKPPVITNPYASVTLSTIDPSEPTVIRGPDVVVEKIDLIPNPSANPETIKVPSAEISKSRLMYYNPSKACLDLYDDLFRAVVEQSESFNMSSYNLPLVDKIAACDLINEESDFFLFHLQYCDFSADSNTVYFIYDTVNTKEIMLGRETLAARLSHILYNVPPENGSDLARFAAIFQYLCETTDSAPEMAGTIMDGPDDLLIKNGGICWAYARLLNYVLSQSGISCDLISNEWHTWNIVQINGKFYHTDLSFAAGDFGSHVNSFETFLMDDTERERTLMDAGQAESNIFLGLSGTSLDKPPVCEDKTFQMYGSIHESYALDIENEKIYLSDYMGIKSMDLDGESLVTLSPDYISTLAFFDGVVYFTSYTDGNLYSLIPGEKPNLLDSEGDNEIVLLEDASLRYGAASGPVKYLSLLPRAADIESAGPRKLPVVNAERGLSYYFTVSFSTPMDIADNWNHYAILTDEKGNPLRTRQTWNEDHTEMTVRPLSSIDEHENLFFYVLSGAPSEDNGMLPQTVCLPVSIDSVADSFPVG